MLDWFKSYLSDRRPRGVLNGCTSDWARVRAGFPQGSILGSLLFSIYINDTVNEIQCVIKLFADDTSLYIIVENPALAAPSLNIDLSYISNRAVDWLVDFHPTKTESMIISRKTFRPNHPPLFMNNTNLTNTDTHKHLGVTFSSNCSWTEHINSTANTAWVRFNLSGSLKFKIKSK